jgi:hypothetical protein
MDLKEIGWEDVDWIHVAQDIDQWQGEHGNETSGFIKCWEFRDQLSDY